MDDEEQISAADLLKLVKAVDASVALWNTLEVAMQSFPDDIRPIWFREWCELRDALDTLGVSSVER